VRNYKDLRVWDEAHQLTLAIYEATLSFPKEERFGLTSQIRRASASIPANLAEGRGRRSDGEMGRFVLIAMGSASELSYHLLLANDLRLLSEEQSSDLNGRVERVSKMLSALAGKLKNTQAAQL
jgi:four helix bundle protein